MEPRFVRVVMDIDAGGLWVGDLPPQLYLLPPSGPWVGPTPVPILTRRPGVIPDFTITLGGLVVVSAAMRALLLPLLDDQVEFVTTTLDGAPSPIWVMHLPAAIDCVDRERSRFTLWKTENRRPDRLGDYRYFDLLVVKSAQVPAALKAFRLLGHTTRVFIEESIARKMAAPSFTGVGLYEHEHS